MEYFADNLKTLLKLRNMSMRELSERSGVSAIAISRYAAGQRTPRSDMLFKICDTLDCTMDDLTTGKLDTEEFLTTDSYREAARLLTTLNRDGLDHVISYINDLNPRFFI